MARLRYTGGSRYALRDGPTWEDGDVHDVDGATADRLTDLDKFETVTKSDNPDAGTVAETIEAGLCPWCEEYEGENVAQHASAAHPGAWEDYTERDS